MGKLECVAWELGMVAEWEASSAKDRAAMVRELRIMASEVRHEQHAAESVLGWIYLYR